MSSVLLIVNNKKETIKLTVKQFYFKNGKNIYIRL